MLDDLDRYLASLTDEERREIDDLSETMEITVVEHGDESAGGRDHIVDDNEMM